MCTTSRRLKVTYGNFADIVDLTNLSGEQKRQLKDMAASMQRPTAPGHDDYRSLS